MQCLWKLKCVCGWWFCDTVLKKTTIFGWNNTFSRQQIRPKETSTDDKCMHTYMRTDAHIYSSRLCLFLYVCFAVSKAGCSSQKTSFSSELRCKITIYMLVIIFRVGKETNVYVYDANRVLPFESLFYSWHKTKLTKNLIYESAMKISHKSQQKVNAN